MKEKVEYFNDNNEDLRIDEIISELSNYPIKIEHFDFTTIGLRTETPKYGNKGIKLKSEYTLNNKIVVQKIFTYTDDGVWIDFEWLNNDDSVGIRKTIFKPLNIVEIHKINKSNRDRSIIYLQASAINTPIQNYVNELLKHYKNEIELFIQNDTDDFKNRILNESEEPFKSYLNIIVDEDNGITVKDSILNQIL